jgi:diguanylate cyclase (GGDEF)-like protein
MLDIDNFKDINDTYGHLYGDEVLTIIAKLMNDSFREYDLLFRYGGEEFSVVLMDIDDEICKQVLNRFRLKVENYDYPKPDKVTISLGYTNFNRELTVGQLIDQADRALYFSKENGRNATHKYQDLVKQKSISAI